MRLFFTRAKYCPALKIETQTISKMGVVRFQLGISRGLCLAGAVRQRGNRKCPEKSAYAHTGITL